MLVLNRVEGNSLLNQQNKFPTRPDKKTNSSLPDKQDETAQQTDIGACTGEAVKEVREVLLLAIIKH